MAPSTSGILAAHWLLTIVAGGLVSARIFLRISIQRQRLLFSDGLLVIAWSGCLAHSALATALAASGALDPANDFTLLNWDVSAARLEAAAKIIYASTFPFFTALYFCKFAFLATYHQLFPVFMRPLRWALYITMAYCITGYLVSVSVQLFLCWPIEGNWNYSTNPDSVCSTDVTPKIFLISWSLHFSANIIIAILPFFILRGLQVKIRVKVGICIVFLLGFIDIAFSLTRFITIFSKPMSFKPLTLIQLWTALDENIALIAACLPALRPYLRVGCKSSSAEASHTYGTHHTSRTPRTQGVGDRDELGLGGLDHGLAGYVGRGADADDDAWSDGRKSNRSDIELVQVKAMHGSEANTSVAPGEVRIVQEFIVSQSTSRHR
ncbi:hypothetical protein ACJZ2D_000330 [Fusarium nematophilum]